MRARLLICTLVTAIAGLGLAQPALADTTGDCNDPYHTFASRVSIYLSNLRNEGVLGKVADKARESDLVRPFRNYSKLLGKHAVVARLTHGKKVLRSGCWMKAIYDDRPIVKLHKGDWVVALLPKGLAKSNVRGRNPNKPGWRRIHVGGVYIAQSSTSRPSAPRNIKLLLWGRTSPLKLVASALAFNGNPTSVPTDTFKAIVKCGNGKWTVALSASPYAFNSCVIGLNIDVQATLAKASLPWTIKTSPQEFRMPADGRAVTFEFRHWPPVGLWMKAKKWSTNGYKKVRLPASKFHYRLSVNRVLRTSRITNAAGGRTKRVATLKPSSVATLCQLRPKRGSFWYNYLPGNRCQTKIVPVGREPVFRYVNTCPRKHINRATGQCRKR